MRNSRLFTGLALAAALMIFSQKIFAQTTWIGPSGGAWATAANWSNGLPAAGNAATIPGGASVAIAAPLTIGFGVESFGTINVTAALTVNAGAIFSNSGTLTASGGGSTTNFGTFNNFGTATFQPSAAFMNETGGAFVNSGPFTVETTLTNKGDIINNGTISALTGTVLSQGASFDNRQVLNTKSLTIAAGTNFINNFGATITISGTAAAMTLNGAINNLGTVNINAATLNVTGTFTNAVSLNINAGSTANVAAGGTMNNTGTLTNKATFVNNGTMTNSNQFLNDGTATNNAAWANNNALENRTGATFTNNTTGTITGNFGSTIINGGTFSNKKTIATPGPLQNTGTFTNDGDITMQNGSSFSNSGTFNNNSLLFTQNTAANSGTLNNSGTLTVQSGSIFTNLGMLKNNPTGRILNQFEINNAPAGTFTNNGTVENQVRIFLQGTTVSNGYFLNTGDVFVRAASSLTNAGLFNQNTGNVENRGTMSNSGTFLNDDCSTVSNYSGLTNTGSFQNRGIVFQRGTLTGTLTNAAGSFTHTGATAASTTICKQNFAPGADVDGTIKVYATALVAFANVDSCQNILYTANGIPRPTFTCATVGTTQNVLFKLKTRLGDSLTCTSPVLMTDKLAPEFMNCPADIQIFTPNNTATATWTAPTVVDNCTAAPTLTANFTPGASFPVGITGVTYTVTDASNNTQQCQFRVIVVKTSGTINCAGDVAGPVFSNCPANVLKTTEFSSEKITWQTPTVTDACGPITLQSNIRPGADFPIGTTTVIYTTKDANNNSSTCSFNVVLTKTDPCPTDVSKPFFANCPSNMFLTTNTNLGGAVGFWTPPAASDNCALASLTSNFQPGQIFPTGTTTVNYTATDGKGNTAVCSFNITVAAAAPCPSDVTGPTFAGCPANISLTTSGASAVANWTAPTATDPCGGVTIAASFQPGSVFPIGVSQVVYTASDLKGNRSTCSFTVTVTNPCFSDATAPTITGCPATLNIAATSANGATVNWTAPTATDACGAVQLSSSYQPGSLFAIGSTTVVYTAIDARGNVASCSFLVNVVQVPTCPGLGSPINNATGQSTASVPLTWNAVTGAQTYDVYLGNANPPAAPVATNLTATTFTATGLTAGTAYYWFVVAKNVAGASQNCSGTTNKFTTAGTAPAGCSNISSSGTIATDETNCGGFNPALITSSATPAGGTGTLQYQWVRFTSDPWANPTAGTVISGATSTTYDPPSITTTTWYRRQARRQGCTTYGSSNFIKKTVITPTAPVAICQNVSVQLNGGTASITAAQVNNGSTAGACGTITSTTLSQTTFTAAGNFPVTLTVTNSSGLTATCTATVSVTSPCTGPTAICQNISVPLSGGTATITAAQIDNGSTGGTCGAITARTLSQSTFTTVGNFPVTLTVMNAAGQTATCTATVTVTNPCTGPTAICQNLSVALSGGTATITAAQIDNGSTGGTCGAITARTLSQSTFTAAGNFPVTLTVTNAAGQTATCTATVTVTVITDPCAGVTITPGAGQITIGGLAAAPIQIVQVFNAAWTQVFNCAGNCQSPTQVISGLPNGTYFVRVDLLTSGWAPICKKEGNFTVGGVATVLTLNSVPNLTATAATGQTSAVVNYTAPTATSTCTVGSVLVTRTAGLASGSAFPIGVSTVNYQATDGCGNVKTTAFTVTVTGGTPPTCTATRTATNTDDTAAPANCKNNLVWGMWFDVRIPNSTNTVSQFYQIQNGVFTENADGTAKLTGLMVNNVDANYRFAIDVDFCGRTFSPPAGSPKTTTCYTINPAGFEYYTTACGKLTGQLAAAGALFNLSRKGEAFQIGLGANLYESTQFGGAGWMMVAVQSQPTTGGIFALTQIDLMLRLSGAALSGACGNGTASCPTTCNAAAGVLTLNSVNNITVTAATGATSAVVNFTPPTATTTCPVGSIVISQTGGLASGAAFPLGATTVTYQASDGCFNAKTTAFTVTVNAATSGDPCANLTFSGTAGAITVGGLDGSPITLVQVFNPSWAQVFSCSGNCQSPTQVIPNLPAGTYFVKVDMLNAAWTSICKKEVYVTVTTGGGTTPILTLSTPPNISVTAASGQTSAIVNYTAPTATSTCTTGSVNVTRTAGPASGSAFPVGTTVVTHTATDGCGNLKAVSFNVVVAPPAGGGTNCDAITMTAQPGAIAITNLTAPITSVQLFKLPSWTPVYNCSGNCTSPNLTVNGLTAGDYIVKVDFYTAGWSPICQKQVTVSVAALAGVTSNSTAFSAWKRDFDVVLQWTPTGFAENDLFVLEKSADGHVFKTWKTVTGKPAAYFEEVDDQPFSGNNFYRLHRIRIDGGIETSEILKVAFANPWTIYPNPASEKAFIDLPGEIGKPAEIELFDQLGRSKRVFNIEKLDNNGAEIDLSGLSDGLFIVRVSIPGRRVATLKLVKEAGQ